MSPELERRALAGIGGLTAVTGALQAAVPEATLRPLGGDDALPVRHFFGTVGMFMVCTGGLLLARPADRAVVLMTAGQKAGASLAVGLAVRRRVLSPLALVVAAFDGATALLALHHWRRLG